MFITYFTAQYGSGFQERCLNDFFGRFWGNVIHRRNFGVKIRLRLFYTRFRNKNRSPIRGAPPFSFKISYFSLDFVCINHL